ncbi:PHP domain protein [Pseudodesulfovibrio profundus]|uniref:PHP domain protein n=2 Tax=Pseudodesulfovibrio profundus TaxID=57320 RepID=A0A2C8F6V0_9BACT|nr:PHP domain protein [Pseudodesulfovibrio profundus]
MFPRTTKQSVHFDMHTHSGRSWESKIPGRLLLTLARQNGLQGIGICEKDAFPDETLFTHAAKLRLKLALGIEFSCRDASIIGFGLDLTTKDQTKLESRFALVREQTLQRAHVLIERLQSWDGTINRKNVAAFAGRDPHPTFIVQYMVQARRMFPSMIDAGRFIAEERLDSDLPALHLPDPVDIIELIHRVGGVSIWAHPFMSPSEKQRPLMATLAEAGLDGIEAVYPYRENGYPGEESNEILQARTLSLTKNTDVFFSGGSDCRYPIGPFEDTRLMLPGEYGITSHEAQFLERVLH